MALEPLIYDETTGLPRLPEGYAWKVSENDYAHHYEDCEGGAEARALIIRISHRKVRDLRWYARLIGKAPVSEWSDYHHAYEGHTGHSNSTPEGIKDAATKIYNAARDMELRSTHMQNLVGLYPPKSIL